MIKFKIYPAKLYVDTKFEISNALKSVEICTTIGEKLANLYNGKFVYEGDGRHRALDRISVLLSTGFLSCLLAHYRRAQRTFLPSHE